MSLAVDIRHTLGAFSLDAAFRATSRAVAIFGPSGAGKTTIVNAIAGIVRPDAGSIVVDDEPLFDSARGVDVPAYRRRVGYVFQDGRLFPHLTVRSNLRYGARLARAAPAVITEADAVSLLGLAPLLDRYPARLSGGEKQRVAIGRALLAAPRLLLMDEPLASLDEPRKQEIIGAIKALQAATRVPLVLVSHALAEIGELADEIVLVAGGRVVEAGPASVVMSNIEFERRASQPSERSVIQATVAAHDAGYDLTTLTSAAGTWTVRRLDARIGARIGLVVDPTDVILATAPLGEVSASNAFSGVIAAIEPRGPLVDVIVDCRGDRVLARITRASGERLALRSNAAIHVLIKTVALERRVAGVSSADGATSGKQKVRG